MNFYLGIIYSLTLIKPLKDTSMHFCKRAKNWIEISFKVLFITSRLRLHIHIFSERKWRIHNRLKAMIVTVIIHMRLVMQRDLSNASIRCYELIVESVIWCDDRNYSEMDSYLRINDYVTLLLFTFYSVCIKTSVSTSLHIDEVTFPLIPSLWMKWVLLGSL